MSEKTSNAKAYNAEYQRSQIRQFKINLNRKTDASIIDYLESQPNVARLMKYLILKQMVYEEKAEQQELNRI